MKNRTLMIDENKDSVNINWLQVLAFGSENENINTKIEALNSPVVFEVMP